MLKEFSKDLKSQREKKNISLEDIAAQSRLSISIFEKFESGDFSFEPEIYIRAFLKQYVKAVELNEDEVLKDYDLAKTGKYTPKVFEEKTEEVIEEEPVKEETDEKIDPKKEIEQASKEEHDKKDDPGLKSESKELNENELKGTTIIKDREKDPVKSKEEEKKEEKKEDRKEKKKPGFKKVKEGSDSIKSETKKEIYKKEADSLRLHSPGGFKKEKAVLSKKESGYSNGSGGGFSITILKKIGVVLIFLAILAGLYFLVDALFLDGSGKDEPEIVRQNFSDVVAESEKKILGKRTEQEIQDSIKAAEEEQRRLLEANLDTMTLVITSKGRGSIVIIEDSASFNNPERITFGRNETGVWKATKFFHISSPNTNSFTAELNGKKINFGKRRVDNYILNRESIAGERETDEQGTNTGETNQNTNNKRPTGTQKPKTEKPKTVKPKKTEQEEEQPTTSEEEKKDEEKKEEEKKEETEDEEKKDEGKKEEETIPEEQPGKTDAEDGN